jgi:hypothetical protein
MSFSDISFEIRNRLFNWIKIKLNKNKNKYRFVTHRERVSVSQLSDVGAFNWVMSKDTAQMLSASIKFLGAEEYKVFSFGVVH